MARSTSASSRSTSTPSTDGHTRGKEMKTGLLSSGHRRARILPALCVAALIASVVVAGSAMAAPVAKSQVVSVASSEVGLGGFQLQAPVVLPDPFPIVLTNLTVTAKAKWSGDITTNVAWDSDKVRQGADLAVSRSASLTSG